MIKNNLYILIFLISHTFIPLKAMAFQIDISNKYDDIFSSKILSEKDIYNYRQAYMFQEQCKWKSANSFILKIKNFSGPDGISNFGAISLTQIPGDPE